MSRQKASPKLRNFRTGQAADAVRPRVTAFPATVPSTRWPDDPGFLQACAGYSFCQSFLDAIEACMERKWKLLVPNPGELACKGRHPHVLSSM